MWQSKRFEWPSSSFSLSSEIAVNGVENAFFICWVILGCNSEVTSPWGGSLSIFSIWNGSVYPCLYLAIHSNSHNQVLIDNYWFTEQIRLTQNVVKVHMFVYQLKREKIKPRWCLQTSVFLFQSKHLPYLRCCTILGMEKSLKIHFMFTFLVHQWLYSHFWFVYLIIHCSFQSCFWTGNLSHLAPF